MQSRIEGKTIIKRQIQKVWQEYWDINNTGKQVDIQKHVGLGKRLARSLNEKVVITCLRIGLHTVAPLS